MTTQLEQQENGYFAGLVPHAAEGTRYRFRLDDFGCFPDPESQTGAISAVLSMKLIVSVWGVILDVVYNHSAPTVISSMNFHPTI